MDENELRQIISENLRQSSERMRLKALGVSTASNPSWNKPATPKQILGQINKLMAQARANEFVIIADEAHEGDIISVRNPYGGQKIEMNFEQLQQLHDHWPMKLRKVIDRHAAEFSPVFGMFNEWVSPTVPTPPFES